MSENLDTNSSTNLNSRSNLDENLSLNANLNATKAYDDDTKDFKNDLNALKNTLLNAKIYENPKWLALLHYENGKSRVQKGSNFFLAQNGHKNAKDEYVATIEHFFDEIERHKIQNLKKSITVKVNMEETEDNMYNIGIGANFTSTDGDNSVYWSNESVCSGGIEAIKITQTSETNGEKIKEFKDVTYTFEIENKGYVIEELGGYSSIVFEDYIPNELNIKSVEYNNYNVEKTGVGPITKYKITNQNKKMEDILVAQANGLTTSSEKARIKLNLNIQNGGKITIKIIIYSTYKAEI